MREVVAVIVPKLEAEERVGAAHKRYDDHGFGSNSSKTVAVSDNDYHVNIANKQYRCRIITMTKKTKNTQTNKQN